MPARKAAEECGGKAVQADLSDHAVLNSLEVEADIVVNNAGLQHVAAIEEFPPERFSIIVRLMLEAPFRFVRKVLPRMYEREWGRVINISSVHGLRASPYKSAYVAAKHGLEGLSKVIALEGGPKVRASPPTASARPTCAHRWLRTRSPIRPASTRSPRRR
jgi:3-hydroxybutyrate dehydrogenase